MLDRSDSSFLRFKKYKIKSRVLLLAGIILIFFSPWLFTRSAFWNFLDFSTTGSIGDTIGGITAPFINLLGAVLIYLSFEQQIVANHFQREGLKVQIEEAKKAESFKILEKHLEEIRDDFFSIKYHRKFEISQVRHKALGHKYFGADALEAYAADIETFKDEILLDVIDFEYAIKYQILLIETFSERLDDSSLLEKDKVYLAKKFLFFYLAKVNTQVHAIIKNSQKIENEREGYVSINQAASRLWVNVESMFDRYGVDLDVFEI